MLPPTSLTAIWSCCRFGFGGGVTTRTVPISRTAPVVPEATVIVTVPGALVLLVVLALSVTV